jgi:hypothetical protein
MQFYVTNISESHAKYSCLVCHEITVGGIGDNLEDPNAPVAELVLRGVAKPSRPDLKA